MFNKHEQYNLPTFAELQKSKPIIPDFELRGPNLLRTDKTIQVGTKLDIKPSYVGTYTPILYNVANLDGSSTYASQYMRLGPVVTVSGKVNVDPTTTATSTKLGISLPFPSRFSAVETCSGTAFCPAIAGQGASILADTTNHRAQMQWLAGDVTAQEMFYTFTYQVL